MGASLVHAARLEQRRHGQPVGNRQQPRGGVPGPRELAHGASARPLVLLALFAVALEALTMLPYLAAVGLVTAADLRPATTALLLAGYCLVMLLPALVLLLVRRLAARRVEPLLHRIERLAARSGGEGTLWATFLIGALLARDAAAGLGLLSG